ncbi:predicted protein [Plenodomus lingam JN3]|uniref:Predicted protein n=1 Tax=Leptosphaeria maculans (strain JN3 / isolate v23.1.3 / race Av1-4-5-6-7-8) TaxID=985895 RepID=E4ZZ87_LEPMJ|nr:predicted protein [Plenodomus lingam JN3]CBX96682.1 predicted protein [Plenodomus lingam JN3]
MHNYSIKADSDSVGTPQKWLAGMSLGELPSCEAHSLLFIVVDLGQA